MPAKASTGLPLKHGERLRIRLEPAVEHRQPARARGRERPAAPAAPSPITSSACARVELRFERRAQRAGRKHLAVADAARGRRPPGSKDPWRAPGFWKPSSMTIDAGAGRARRVGAGDAVARHDGRRDARQQQRLVADVGRAMARRIDPHRPGERCRHSRGSARTACGRPPPASAPTAIAVGVLPAPPSVRLPMQTTGMPAPRARPRHARAPATAP